MVCESPAELPTRSCLFPAIAFRWESLPFFFFFIYTFFFIFFLTALFLSRSARLRCAVFAKAQIQNILGKAAGGRCGADSHVSARGFAGLHPPVPPPTPPGPAARPSHARSTEGRREAPGLEGCFGRAGRWVSGCWEQNLLPDPREQGNSLKNSPKSSLFGDRVAASTLRRSAHRPRALLSLPAALSSATSCIPAPVGAEMAPIMG